MSGIRKLWDTITGKGAKDPKAIFDEALAEFHERYRRCRDLVAETLKERDRVRGDRDRTRAELARASRQALAAVKAARDDEALVHLEQEKLLEEAVADLEGRVETLEGEAARAREALLRLASEVERLERDRATAIRLGTTGTTREQLRSSLLDLEESFASPALDRARSELEHATLTERFAGELNESDRRERSKGRSAAERLRSLKGTG